MKILESAKLVQFYLYDKEDIRIGKHTAVVGPNGTGKSTLMDAIQIAIMGANSRHIALNAQADEKHMSRSLRSYCLGQFGDSPEDRVREASTTYITLIWRDTKTGAPTTTGVCISASSDSEQHTVLGRYILRDVELSMSDHVQMINGQEHPREWGVFRQQLLDRAKVNGENPLYPDSEKFIHALLLALRGSGGMPSVDAFTRALRFGLRMRFNKTVDEIVRYDVLEARPTNIKHFKQVTDSFKKLALLVAEVKEKIEEGNKVIDEFDKAESESAKAVTWSVVATDAAREAANEVREQAITDRTVTEEAMNQFRERLKDAKREEATLQETIQHLRTLRDNHAAHKTHGELQRKIEVVKANFAADGLALTQAIRGINHLAKSVALKRHLPTQSAKLQDAEWMTAPLLNGEFPAKDSLSKALNIAVDALSACFNDLFQVSSRLRGEIGSLEQAIKACEDDLTRASTGKPRLSENVSTLMRHLRDYSLTPEPVCDLVRITDPHWQPVIEAYLGAHREALLVRGEEERDAFRLYREAHGIYGVKLARESSQDVAFRPERGSVAELIDGNDRAAVAYLRAKFGNLMRAETNEEALAGGRTLTKDGMLVSRGEVDRIKPLREHEFRIGIVAADQSRIINQELAKLRTKKDELQAEHKTVEDLTKQLLNYSNKRQKIDTLLAMWGTCEKHRQTQESFELALVSSADEEYVKLGQGLNAAEETLNSTRRTIERLAGEAGGAEKDWETAKRREASAIEAAARAAEKANEERKHPEYRPDFASDQWDKLLDRCGQDFLQMKVTAERSSGACTRSRDSAAQRGSGLLGSFAQKHREQVGREVMDDWRRAGIWIRELIKRLTDTDLVTYEEEMNEAYRASQEAFRTDVAVTLNTHIDALDHSMTRLNKALRQCPTFSNGERYQFARRVRPHLQSLLKFIQDVASNGGANDLFGASTDIPPEFKELLDDKIAPGGTGNRSPLDDYREFFEFEIDILREDPTTGQRKVVGKLSKRLGTGSGGEHRAPLYVIAGAALASAYRLDEGHRDGMGLILLDEAFNKMDITNITATMRYLDDLGLQVVMASPGENLSILMAFLHRYYDIMRDPDANVVFLDGHDVSEETRQIYRSDLPEFNPDLIEAELRSTSHARRDGETAAIGVA